jgi:hypothetical protein
MEKHEAKVYEMLTRQLRACELLEGELSARLAGDLDFQRTLEASQDIAQVLDGLEADNEFADAVKVARQGADAVVLGEELVVIANLVQNLALIAMPVALVLAARVKHIGDVTFFKGVPKHLVDVVNGLKAFVPSSKSVVPPKSPSE